MKDKLTWRNFIIKSFENKANQELANQLYAHDQNGFIPPGLTGDDMVGLLGS